MEPLADLAWVKDLLNGNVVERIRLEGFRAVALEIDPRDERHHSQYRYRLLVFPRQENKPVLALNLETSLLGTPCLTEQTGAEHQIVADATEEMEYAEFRRWALERALADLHTNHEPG